MKNTVSYESNDRFGFGSNWKNFLSVVDDERLLEADKSLKDMLGLDSLKGKTFLDIGSGSGLFSLAARRLGARVLSFDFDKNSVECTKELKKSHFPDDSEWQIEQGSALDIDYINKFDKFDIVYSWGVLHHTGAMWIGIENAISRVADDGLLYIAIYNDQGWKSHVWWLIKFIYNKLPSPLDKIYGYTFGFTSKFLVLIKYLFKGKPMVVISEWLNYKKKRGMSILHDMIDWIGGYPFEFASYDVLKDYMRARGFDLRNGEEATSLGCHKMVFKRQSKCVE